MMMVLGEQASNNPTGEGPSDSLAPTTWKSYTNPLFHNPTHHRHRHRRQRRRHRSNDPNSIDLEALRAELENERRRRRKAETQCMALARELEGERQRREAVEGEIKVLSLEARRAKEEMGRVREEVVEERRAMRAMEVMREERVQRRLTEARLQMEERLVGFQKAAILEGTHARKSMGEGRAVEEEEEEEEEGKGRRRRENPHIRRGAIGFVEFPRMVRAREGKGETGGLKLECQKAQLRVLLRKNRVSPLGNGGYL